VSFFLSAARGNRGDVDVDAVAGAACDVPTALYSFSFAQNPEWTALHPSADEIKEYLLRVAADYGIPAKTTFRTAVYAAEWDGSRDRWRVHLRSLDTGEEYVHECKILVSAVGLLTDPNVPDIKGRETFAGEQVHSARWKRDVQLEGKRVALVGNGCEFFSSCFSLSLPLPALRCEGREEAGCISI